MFSFRRGAYRRDVLLIAGTLLGDDSGDFRRAMRRSSSGIENAIKSAYEKKQCKDELAVTLAQVLLVETIEKIDDPDRKAGIANRLRTWLSPAGFAQFRKELPNINAKDVDGLELRLWCFFSSVVAMREEKRIQEVFYYLVVGEILGALVGLSADGRRADFLRSLALHVGLRIQDQQRIGISIPRPYDVGKT